MFAEIGLLVLEGDAAGLAAKVSELSSAELEHVPADDSAEEESAAPGIHPNVDNHEASIPLVHSPDS
jgi:hypothetical protein